MLLILAYFGSYGFEPSQGVPLGGPIVNEANARIKAQNYARKIKQRIGLGLLCASFVAQAAAVVLAGS